MRMDGHIRGFGVTYGKFNPLHREERCTVSSGKMPEYSPAYGDVNQYMYQMEFYGIEKMG